MHRNHDPFIVKMPCPAGTSITDVVATTTYGAAPNSLMYYDETANKLKPVNALAYDTTGGTDAAKLLNTQRKAAAMFVGMLNGAIDRNDPAEDRGVIVGGEVSLPCASATFKRGDYLTFAQQTGVAALHAYKVIKTRDRASAIARVTTDQASVTKVRCHLLPRMWASFNPQSEIHEVSFHCPGLATAGNIVAGFTFGRKVRVIESIFVDSVVVDANAVITLSRGAAAFTQTHSVPTAASAIGRVTTTVYDDAATLAEKVFEATDTLTAAQDGGATTNGAGTLVIRFVDLPGGEE